MTAANPAPASATHSAHEVARSNGHVGTEQDNCKWTKGADASQGWLGAGHTGSVENHLARLRGASASQLWPNAGHEGTEADFLDWVQIT